jgi:glycerophosphocholine phosphodiesterase GPCPD1
LKQTAFPVLFLTQGVTKKWPPYLDPRTQSTDYAIRFAKATELMVRSFFLISPFLSSTHFFLDIFLFCTSTREVHFSLFRFPPIYQGISGHAEEILTDTKLITRALEEGLILFIWGEDTNDRNVIRQFKNMGVHGIIVDR